MRAGPSAESVTEVVARYLFGLRRVLRKGITELSFLRHCGNADSNRAFDDDPDCDFTKLHGHETDS
jgi:hypothetical protein